MILLDLKEGRVFTFAHQLGNVRGLGTTELTASAGFKGSRDDTEKGEEISPRNIFHVNINVKNRSAEFAKVEDLMVWGRRWRWSRAVRATSRSTEGQTATRRLSVVLRSLLISHRGAAASSQPGAPCKWQDTGLIVWQPGVLPRGAKSLCQCAWACQLTDCRTTRRMINKWWVKNYIYPWLSVRCVGVSRKLSVWFHFSFVGHNFMLLHFLMCRDVWFD